MCPVGVGLPYPAPCRFPRLGSGALIQMRTNSDDGLLMSKYGRGQEVLLPARSNIAVVNVDVEVSYGESPTCRTDLHKRYYF
jgi:hypothetical protein